MSKMWYAHDILLTIDVDLNVFDIEKMFQKPGSSQRVEMSLVIVEFASKGKRNKLLKQRRQVEYKSSRICIKKSLTVPRTK